MSPHNLPWSDPLEFLAGLKDSQENYILLYSGMHTSYSGQKSLLALHPAEQIKASDFAQLSSRLSMDQPAFANAWFGYLGYGLKNTLENLPVDTAWQFALPDLWMTRFHTILLFDHENHTLTCWQDKKLQLPTPQPKLSSGDIIVTSLRSNMSKAEYLQKVETLLESIQEGALYQANLTRKFFGEWEGDAHPATLFTRLTQISPAAYSAFVKLDETCVLSSSPERFLHLDSEGNVTAQPIKGTSPRHADPLMDEQSRMALAGSSKDQAENLMIVDLMRNDLSRACVTGSVEVDKLFEITSYATIHHMASTITGRRKPEATALDLVEACFPPGSMTGAPKIRAMKHCTQLEEIARGIYSGAIGWFGGDGSTDLSVVIRTLILNGKRFEFQVGGGIVADSNPLAEWEETLAKSRAINKLLGINYRKISEL